MSSATPERAAFLEATFASLGRPAGSVSKPPPIHLKARDNSICALCTLAIDPNDEVYQACWDTNTQKYYAGDRICPPSCSVHQDHKRDIVAALHPRCASHPAATISTLCAITSADFTVEHEHTASFLDLVAIRRQLREALCNDFISCFPFSTVDDISGYLLDTFILASISLPSSSSAPREEHVLDLTKNVWATFIKVQGRVYVKDLANEHSRGSVLVYEPFEAGFVHSARDQWGVRRVMFSRHEQKVDVEEVEGVWWASQEIKESDKAAYIKTDGFKMRFLSFHEGRHPRRPKFLWPFPVLERCQIHDQWDKKRTGLVFSGKVLNATGTCGYSVRAEYLLASLTAHTSLHTPSSSVLTDDDDHARLFLPMSEGEVITKMSFTAGRYEATLVFMTSHNRLRFFTYHKPGISRHRIHTRKRIYFTDPPIVAGAPTRIYVDAGVRPTYTAIEGGQGVKRQQDDPLPVPPVSKCPPSLYQRIFFTRASLELVAWISPCRHKGTVVGLLIQYVDGTLEALGEVKPGYLEAEMDARGSLGLWFLRTRDGGNSPVTEVSLSPPGEDEEIETHEFPWRGELEWWFTKRLARIAQRERIVDIEY